jgi:phage terminase large subunit
MTQTLQSPTAPSPDRELHFHGAAGRLGHCRAREVLIEGPAGTGKTLACLAKCVWACSTFRGARVLIARATRASMTESVLVTLERDLLHETHPARLSSEAQRGNRRFYRWPDTKAEIIVAGLDNTERVMSTEYDLIFVAESTEITEEDWERLLTRLRNNRMPYQQAIADCNPSAPGHWLNMRAARGQMTRLQSRHTDNPSLTPEYLDTLRGLTGHRRARLFEGRWVAGEGTVFPEFDDQRHVMAPFAVPGDWPQIVGLDPGYDHPCAILWLAIAPNGCLYVVDELYRGGKSVAEHAADIHARNAGRTVRYYYADPQHAFSSTAQSPKSIAQQFAECSPPLRFGPWPRSTDKEAMVNAVRERLAADRLKVFATCANTIREFQSWSYRRTAKGELPTGDDQFEDRDNHAMDVICGLVATNPAHRVGPAMLARMA